MKYVHQGIKMWKSDKAIKIAAIALFFAVLTLRFIKVVTVAETVNSLLLVGLVTATIIYAKRTAEIAKATKEQANASVKMAEQTKEQTKILKETVSLTIRPSFDMTIIDKKGGNNYQYEPPEEFNIRIENRGKGPARGLFISCSGNGIQYTTQSLRNLNQGDNEFFSIQRQTSIDQQPKVKQLLLTIIYLDDLGDTLETSMPINCDGNNWKPGAIIPIREENNDD